MRRRLVLSLVLVCTWVTLAYSGSPHFNECSVERSGNTLIFTGKMSGLGNETQVHIEATATAECINPGGGNPKAANKESISAEGTFPVQNGKALFLLELEATFSPSCSPPMSVAFSDVTACDTEHDVCCTL